MTKLIIDHLTTVDCLLQMSHYWEPGKIYKFSSFLQQCSRFRSSGPENFWGKDFLEIPPSSQENACKRVSF